MSQSAEASQGESSPSSPPARAALPLEEGVHREDGVHREQPTVPPPPLGPRGLRATVPGPWMLSRQGGWPGASEV